MKCPFEEEVGDVPSPERCQLWDSATCHCLADVITHGFGGVDDQSSHIVSWWGLHASFDCTVEWPRRVLPEFTDRGSTLSPGPLCVICGRPGRILCEEHR